MARPAKWEDPEAFEQAVDHYFEREIRHTWTGLAVHLGFESRQSLEDYKKKEGFSYPIKKALLRIEANYEDGLWGKNPAGSIFALKNFGWRDKLDIAQETTIKDDRIDESKLSADDLRSLIEIRRKVSTNPSK